MTLRARLAAMMVLVLVAVVALQFLLMERDRRALLERLDELGSGLDEATAMFVAETHHAMRSPGPVDVDQFLRSVLAETDTVSGTSQIEIFVWADTANVTMRSEFDARRAFEPHAIRARFPSPGEFPDSLLRQTESERIEAVMFGDSAGLACDDSVLIILQTSAETLRFEGHPDSLVALKRRTGGARDTTIVVRGVDRSRFREHWLMNARPRGDIAINLPVPGQGDSLYAVQVRLPTTALAEELDRSRRHGLLWLAAILGVGVFGTVLVASQFTRPIRTLEDSFGQVVEGNLDLEVDAPREDEMGRLTHAFNHMVGRLRQSRVVEERLHEAERLASVGRLAAGVAHEVRNPLNAILLTMQQMRDKVGTRLEDDGQRRDFQKYFGVVTGELQRLEALVGAFLDLSKAGAVRPQRVDAAESLRVSAELFRPQAEENGVRVVAEIPESLPLEADPARLPMVWNNLLANALDAAGTEVILRAEVEAAGEGRSRVHVMIRDDGPGVPEDERTRIWEPFYSGRPGGTGLGLSIVRSVVEQHGGDVTVESHAGDRGGTFTAMHVRLPCVSQTDGFGGGSGSSLTSNQPPNQPSNQPSTRPSTRPPDRPSDRPSEETA